VQGAFAGVVAALHGEAGEIGGRGVGWDFGESQEQDQLDVMNAEVGIGTFEAKKVFADGLRLLCVDEPLSDGYYGPTPANVKSPLFVPNPTKYAVLSTRLPRSPPVSASSVFHSLPNHPQGCRLTSGN
jgi:hypothetical protein